MASIASLTPLVFFICYCLAQSSQWNPITDYCQRWWHQSTIKNGTLYIDGGVETFVNGSANDNMAPVTGITIDLSVSWDWKVNISEKLIPKTPNPTIDASAPALMRGALYAGSQDDANIYLYGGTVAWFNVSFPGFEPPTTEIYPLWSYDTQTGIWNEYEASPQAPYRPSAGPYTEAPNLGLGLFYNGEIDSGSSTESQDLGSYIKFFLEGLIVLNMTTQTLQNYSTVNSSGDYPRTRGGLVYIPGVGESGVLVQIGGSYKALGEAGFDEESNYMNMSEVDIFDVETLFSSDPQSGFASGWYKQNATGAIPTARGEFCMVAVSAVDNSSHNIYIYGGQNGATNEVFDDVYVLSLPSFVWTRVYGPGPSPRYGHTCHLVGERQMLTVGGTLASEFALPCDWETKGVAILDMTNILWGSVYDAHDSPYEVPSQIVEVIGGSGNGNASVRAPVDRFSSCELGNLFGSTSLDSCVSLPDLFERRREHTRIIIGAVVGVVMAILIIFAGWLLWHYRENFWGVRFDRK